MKPVVPPAAEDKTDATAEEEPPVRSWFASSLDLHKGLDISDAPEDTTQPMPLSERRRN